MGKRSARLSVDAIEHFDTTVAVPVESIEAEFRQATNSSSPIRVGLGAAANLDFIEPLVDDLVHFGVEAGQAERFLATVLIAPTIAMMDAFGCGVLQSVLVKDVDDEHATRVTVRAELETNARGGVLSNVKVTAEPFDPEDIQERAALIAALSFEALRYPVPAPTAGRVMTVAVVGNPSRQGLLDSGHSWNDVLKSMARALNVDLQIRTSSQSLKDALPQSTGAVFLFDPSLESSLRSTNPKVTPHTVECSGRELRRIVEDIALAVLTELESTSAVAPIANRRKLYAGDKYFHRKVGTSAAFDRFGDPCKPCSHNSFVRYFRAAKAEKGMARIYENFRPDMLYHCSKGYNCGIYAVFAPPKL